MQKRLRHLHQITATESWVDQLFETLAHLVCKHARSETPMAIAITSFLCAFAVYVLGLIIAASCSFVRVYSSTGAIYYGFLGIAWVLGWLRWGLLRFPHAINNLTVCFASEPEFLDVANRAIRRMNNRAGAFSFSILIFCFSVTAVTFGLFVFVHDEGRIRLLSLPWYQSDPIWHEAILLVFGAGCCLLLGTGFWILGVNATFLKAIGGLRGLPLPGILIARFRPLTAFYLRVSVSWYVGFALIALLFVNHLDRASVTVLFIISALGLITALVPQLVFHAIITQAANDMAGDLAQVFKTKLSGRIEPVSLAQATSILQASQPVQMWVINFKDILILASGQLFPIASVALKVKLVAMWRIATM